MDSKTLSRAAACLNALSAFALDAKDDLYNSSSGASLAPLHALLEHIESLVNGKDEARERKNAGDRKRRAKKKAPGKTPKRKAPPGLKPSRTLPPSPGV